MLAPAFPETDATVTLTGPAGDLQAQVEWPDADTAVRPAIAIVCHPLPTEGGTMDNKVVTMTARALRELGIVTVRFNFRGTGASAGTFDHGDGESADLQAVAAWVRAQRPDAALWLAGFSFGAYVSLRCAQALQPAVLISLAPPAGRWAFEQIAVPQMPWLVVIAQADEVVDVAAIDAQLDAWQPPQLMVERLDGASHFFHGRLVDLRTRLRERLQPLLDA